MSRPHAATVESAATSRATSPVRHRSSTQSNSIASDHHTESVSSERLTPPKKTFRLPSSWKNVFEPILRIDYHHVMMAIAVIQILLTSLLLGGCTIEGLRGLYIASFRETSQPMANDLMLNQSLPQLVFDQVLQIAEGNASVKEVRTGYFAMCVTSDRGEHTCGLTDRGSKVADLADPLGLVAAAYHFRNQAITPGLIIISLVLSAVYIFCLSRYPDWHEEEDSDGSVREIKPFPSQWITWFSIATASVSSILLYIAVMWQQVGVAAAAVAMKGFRYGLVDTGTGAAAAALGWVSVGLICLAALGIVVMMLSIRLLQSLV